MLETEDNNLKQGSSVADFLPLVYCTKIKYIITGQNEISDGKICS